MFLSNVHPLLPVSSAATLQDPPAPMDSLEPTLVVPQETQPGDADSASPFGKDGYLDPPPSPVACENDESSLQMLLKQLVIQT